MCLTDLCQGRRCDESFDDVLCRQSRCWFEPESINWVVTRFTSVAVARIPTCPSEFSRYRLAVSDTMAA